MSVQQLPAKCYATCSKCQRHVLLTAACQNKIIAAEFANPIPLDECLFVADQNGKTPSLCSPLSLAYADCKNCLNKYKGTRETVSADSVLPSLSQFLDYCKTELFVSAPQPTLLSSTISTLDRTP